MSLRKVLVIDDEVRILRFTSLALKASGYEVITSATGKTAVELAESIKPDIILMDIFLADIDGFELLKKIRSSSDVPIIAFSARSGIANEALSLGANDFLTKPFIPEELMRRIEAILPASGIG